MTTRICIFGNSHIAALRAAWQADPRRWPDLHIDCVGAHRGLLLETEVRHGWLRPITTDARTAFSRLGGGHGVRLKDYDALVVAGCLISPSLVVGLYRHMHWVGLNSTASHPDLASSEKALVSEAAVFATAKETYANRLGAELVRHLRPHTDVPILLTAQPRISADLLLSRDPTVQGHKQVHQHADGAALSVLADATAAEAVRDAGGTYVAQPDQTITHGVMTDPSFMRGALRLTPEGRAPQPPSDLRHANALYGAAVLDQISAHHTASS